MQHCPLCNTEFNDVAKICPKLHCDNCGSLNLNKRYIRNFKNFGSKTDYEFFRFVSAFFIFFPIIYIYSRHGISFEMIYPIIAFGAFQILLYIYKTKSANLYLCKECGKDKLTPIKEIILGKKEETSDEKRKIIEENVKKNISEENLLNEVTKSTKYSKKQLTAIIISIVVTVALFVFQVLIPFLETGPDLVISGFGNVDNPYAHDTVTYEFDAYNQGNKAAEGCIILLDDGITNSSKITSDTFVIIPNKATPIKIQSHVYPSIGKYLVQADLQCTNYPKIKHTQMNLDITMTSTRQN